MIDENWCEAENLHTYERGVVPSDYFNQIEVILEKNQHLTLINTEAGWHWGENLDTKQIGWILQERVEPCLDLNCQHPCHMSEGEPAIEKPLEDLNISGYTSFTNESITTNMLLVRAKYPFQAIDSEGEMRG